MKLLCFLHHHIYMSSTAREKSNLNLSFLFLCVLNSRLDLFSIFYILNMPKSLSALWKTTGDRRWSNMRIIIEITFNIKVRERDSESWDSRFVSFTRETGLYIYSSRKMQTRHNVECATRLCAYERSTHRAARREIEKSRSERKSERKMNEFFCVGTHIIISYSSKQAIGARLMHCRSADDFKMLEQLARGTCVKF